MDQQQQQGSQPSKVERKVIEKNRRNKMKNLYSQLNSLLPTHNSREVTSVPDQIDEAINHIKTLETNMKTAQEKKKKLIESSGGCSSASEAQGRLKPPKIEIHERGTSLQVMLTCGVDNQFSLSEIIRILHEEHVEVISANSSVVGDSVIHLVHGQVQQSSSQSGATKVSEKLKLLVDRSINDMDMEPELWDFDIGTTDTWGLIDPTLDPGLPPNP